jgi:PAS domain S-box-containing protein
MNTADFPYGRAAEELFDRLEDIVYFIKDREALYVSVNTTLVRRLGKSSKAELIGRHAGSLFPAHLAQRITAQDADVLSHGTRIENELELHLYPDGQQGWCLTTKQPLRDGAGRITGLAGISRDLRPLASAAPELDRLSTVLDYVRRHVDQPLTVAELAAHAGLSAWQLDQRVRGLLGISLAQFVLRSRIDRACVLLRSSGEPVSSVALAAGYSDQAAFTRQFGKSVGLTPGAYRKAAREW